VSPVHFRVFHLLGRIANDLRQAPVLEFDAPVGQTADGLRMRHQQNGVPGGMKIAQQVEHNFFVGFIQIAGGFVASSAML
jgi:hypothetical protein